MVKRIGKGEQGERVVGLKERFEGGEGKGGKD